MTKTGEHAALNADADADAFAQGSQFVMWHAVLFCKPAIWHTIPADREQRDLAFA